MKKEMMAGLFIFLLVAYTSSCNSRQPLPTGTVTITMDSLVTDSVPFVPQMRIVRFVKDTSFEWKGEKIDSIKLLKIITLDNIDFSNRQATDEKFNISFLFGIYQGKKILVFDTNNDKSFVGENIREFDVKGVFTQIDNVSLQVGKEQFSSSYFVRPAVSGISIPRNSKNPGVEIEALPVYRYGKFTGSDGEPYKLAVFNQFYTEYNNDNSFLVIIPAANRFPKGTSFPVQYRPNDTMYLNRQQFKFAGISNSGDTIHLQPLEIADKNFGITEAAFILPTKLVDIQDGKRYEIGASDKYTLLDFWGTWCGPCIELTGDLKAINEQYKSKVQLVSIAYDESEQKVLHYLRQNDIHWINSFDNMNNSIVASKFKVNDFPTFILLDKEGKIIKRGVGKVQLDAIKSFLQTAR